MKTKTKNYLNLWGILVYCFVVLFFLPTPASPEEPYKFERMWPYIQQPWYFNLPRGIASDSYGNVYIADTGNSRIQKFSSDGNLITNWGSTGSGDGEFNRPEALIIDSSNNIYVADQCNHRIQKFTSDGEFVAKWGRYGLGDGQLNRPSGIAVDSSNNVYVADEGNNRIQKFTSNGTFITKWGNKGNKDEEFEWSEYEYIGIAIDKNDNIYVVDKGNNRIQKFTSSGDFAAKWGSYWDHEKSEGSGDGKFNQPMGIAIDSSGNVYVADSGNGRIQKFSPDGLFIAEMMNFYITGRVISIDSDGHFYVASDFDRVYKFDSNGALIVYWGSDGSGDGEFFIPRGVALNEKGDLYVADEVNHRIQKFTSSGDFIAKWGQEGGGVGDFIFPQAISIDPDGNIYVTERWNHRIQKFNQDGIFITKWGTYGTGDGKFDYPNGLAIDASGNVYVTDTENHRIQKFTSNGEFITKWGSYWAHEKSEGSGDGKFNQPFGIAIDSSGNVYVADMFNHRIQKFTSNGEFITKWGGTEVSDKAQLCCPMGLSADINGNIYAADSGHHCIKKYTSKGQFLTTIGEHGFGQGGLSGPVGVCVSPTGKVYVSDTHNNRIQVFSQEGASSNIKTAKAIILAGSGPFTGNNIWEATEMCANYAYRALTYQGFTKDSIYYLSSDTDLDLDGNGIPDDVDANATNNNLKYAITTWAKDTEDLFIYMVGHGGEGTFRIGELELLTAEDLDKWLDTIQGMIPGTVTILYDACRSGSFLSILDPPSGRERILATSTSNNQEAIFGSQGTISFSFLFWARMFNGDSLYDSFYHATNSIGVTYRQNPLLEGNGNGIGNEKEDKDIVRVLKIGNETKSAGDIPVIGSVPPARTVDGQTSALIYADNVIDADGISRVWAVITPPDYSPNSPDNPVTDLPVLELNSKGNNRYEGTYRTFTAAGTYTIAIFASDRRSVISLPKSTTVTVSDGHAYGDVAPLGNRDGMVNVGDALIALRFALTLEIPTQEDMQHGDVAPLDANGQPNPDGVINVGDALVILRKALGIVGF